MPEGTLEVLLVCARNLSDKDFFTKNDPYAIISCHNQEQRSTVKKGCNPDWNETLMFSISDGMYEVRVRLYDEDMIRDDFLGETTIPLDAVFAEGSIPPATYDLIRHDKVRGEVRVGLNFFPSNQEDMGYRGEDREFYRGGGSKVIVQVTRDDDDSD